MTIVNDEKNIQSVASTSLLQKVTDRFIVRKRRYDATLRLGARVNEKSSPISTGKLRAELRACLRHGFMSAGATKKKTPIIARARTKQIRMGPAAYLPHPRWNRRVQPAIIKTIVVGWGVRSRLTLATPGKYINEVSPNPPIYTRVKFELVKSQASFSPSRRPRMPEVVANAIRCQFG